jgi:lysylphosphatidylglycerol synthetase-like protein (DUF2156 family)
MSARELRPAALAVAPSLAGIIAGVAGILLLASGATPSEPTRFAILMAVAPSILIELSHFLSSILGLVLLLLAFGLRARLDAAWWAALVCLAAAAVLAVFKGLNWEETALLSGAFVLIAPFHEAFPRQAALSRMEITPGWLLSAATALAGVALCGWWIFTHTEYADQSWIKMMGDQEAARAIRSSAAAGILLIGIGVWRLIATPATPSVVDDTDPDFDRVRGILAKAEAAETSSNLALLGDKRFLFSASGESFLMFGVRKRSWIAMGPPVGRRDERVELFWRFRELADAHAARAGFYALGPDDLPDSVDLGLAIQKTGESAAVPLEAFSMAGRRREVLRRNWRRAGEGGAAFEVLPVGAAPAIMDELQAISDAWLAHHSGGEKGFSMGGFDPRYVAEFPVAVVRVEGRIVAFATLWLTAHKAAFSMDLMRYADDAPKNVMDYLFVELLQWGKTMGYGAFEFGMAPLAGLDDRPLAPIMSRVGRLLYERGEEIYNFQGVRRYKDKYDPVWQPRYIAAPHKWSIPFLLADISLLSSGGVSGLTKRPRPSSAGRRSESPAD